MIIIENTTKREGFIKIIFAHQSFSLSFCHKNDKDKDRKQYMLACE